MYSITGIIYLHAANSSQAIIVFPYNNYPGYLRLPPIFPYKNS